METQFYMILGEMPEGDWRDDPRCVWPAALRTLARARVIGGCVSRTPAQTQQMAPPLAGVLTTCLAGVPG